MNNVNNIITLLIKKCFKALNRLIRMNVEDFSQILFGKLMIFFVVCKGDKAHPLLIALFWISLDNVSIV